MSNLSEKIKKRKEELTQTMDQLKQVEAAREELTKRVLVLQGAISQLEELEKEEMMGKDNAKEDVSDANKDEKD